MHGKELEAIVNSVLSGRVTADDSSFRETKHWKSLLWHAFNANLCHLRLSQGQWMIDLFSEYESPAEQKGLIFRTPAGLNINPFNFVYAVTKLLHDPESRVAFIFENDLQVERALIRMMSWVERVKNDEIRRSLNHLFDFGRFVVQTHFEDLFKRGPNLRWTIFLEDSLHCSETAYDLVFECRHDEVSRIIAWGDYDNYVHPQIRGLMDAKYSDSVRYLRTNWKPDKWDDDWSLEIV